MKKIYFLFAGLLSSTAFAPFELWISAFAGLFLWFYWLDKSNRFTKIVGSYIYGLGLLLPAQHWTGIYVGNLPWIALCLVQAIFFIIPALFYSKSRVLKPLIFAGSYVLVELLLRTVPFTGFGWSRLSYTQTESPIAGLYPLGGVVLVAWTLAFIVSIRTLSLLIITLLFLVVVNFVPDSVSKNGEIKIALIQGGVSELGLNFNSKPKEVFLRHLDQTKKLSERVDLIIWPENAVDIDINQYEEVKQQIVGISKIQGTPILVGGVTNSASGPKNQSMLFNPDLSKIYTKRYLTPFGEYLPIRSIATIFSPYADDINDFEAGNEDQTFFVGLNSFKTLICYELINDKFRDEIDSDFLVVQTNNATFGDTYQLEQELNIAKVRALETGRSIAYVSTTGITSFISNLGKVMDSAEKFKQTTLVGDIDLVEGRTSAQKYGFYLEYLFILSLVAIILRRLKLK